MAKGSDDGWAWQWPAEARSCLAASLPQAPSRPLGLASKPEREAAQRPGVQERKPRPSLGTALALACTGTSLRHRHMHIDSRKQSWSGRRQAGPYRRHGVHCTGCRACMPLSRAWAGAEPHVRRRNAPRRAVEADDGRCSSERRAGRPDSSRGDDDDGGQKPKNSNVTWARPTHPAFAWPSACSPGRAHGEMTACSEGDDGRGDEAERRGGIEGWATMRRRLGTEWHRHIAAESGLVSGGPTKRLGVPARHALHALTTRPVGSGFQEVVGLSS
ncbi:hypothetical protein CDD83_189 [Cordyceps sp. RAO-2017]|nr:hypothetical protein CDD83_189 [Cordyceps sp. RAO-2017]